MRSSHIGIKYTLMMYDSLVLNLYIDNYINIVITKYTIYSNVLREFYN